MRTIKFRAWDKENKVMHLAEELSSIAIQLDGTIMVRVGGWEYDTKDGDLKSKNLVLMQFTGLHDAHGKEIYEGDILKCETEFNLGRAGYKGKVIYNATRGSFEIKGHLTYDVTIKRSYSFKDCCDLQIIGNAYENPNLLENK